MPVICMRKEKTSAKIVPHSHAGECSECKAEVWVAPSTMRMREACPAKHPLICIPCFDNGYQSTKEIEVCMNADQLTEIIQNKDLLE